MTALNRSQKLLKLANEFYQMKPWIWVFEDDIIGIEDPQTKVRGFASVMGSLGEHLSITFYLGIEALHKFWLLHEDPENTPPEIVLETTQFMLSFEDPDDVMDEDAFLLPQVDYALKMDGRVPVFRSYKPGMFPIPLSKEEERLMVIFLEQAIDVIQRFEKNRDLLFPVDSDDDWDVYLIREAKDKGDGQLVWTDRFHKLDFDSLPIPDCTPDPGLIAQLKTKPFSMKVFEASFKLYNAPVKNEDESPYFPYIMLLVDKKKDFIIGYELLSPAIGFDAMLKSVTDKFLAMFAEQTHLPKEIHVSDARLYELLIAACRSLKIKLVQKKVLRLSQNIIDNYLTDLS
jgi:hypothetical protein